jgi:hypothetical protein
MKTIDTIIPLFERLVKSNGFAIVVMFGMMTAMAYTLWNQYNRMNERLTALEGQIIECYKENTIKNNELIEKNTRVMEEVIIHLKNVK